MRASTKHDVEHEHGVEHLDDARVDRAGREQEHSVEHLDVSLAGLVRLCDSAMARSAPAIWSADALSTVESGGGIIEHEHGRSHAPTHGLDADGDASPLATREALDPGVRDAGQGEVVDHGGVVRVRNKAEARAEVERLASRTVRSEKRTSRWAT